MILVLRLSPYILLYSHVNGESAVHDVDLVAGAELNDKPFPLFSTLPFLYFRRDSLRHALKGLYFCSENFLKMV